MFETYKGKIVQVTGGINTYIGEIETFQRMAGPKENEDRTMNYGPAPVKFFHPNGPGWIRINNPVQVREFHEGKNIQMVLERMGGIAYNFKPYVDEEIPQGESLMEIRELEPGSELDQLYHKEWGREKPSLIASPTTAELMKVAEKKH